MYSIWCNYSTTNFVLGKACAEFGFVRSEFPRASCLAEPRERRSGVENDMHSFFLNIAPVGLLMSSGVCLSPLDVERILPVKPGFLRVFIQVCDDRITYNSNTILGKPFILKLALKLLFSAWLP